MARRVGNVFCQKAAVQGAGALDSLVDIGVLDHLIQRTLVPVLVMEGLRNIAHLNSVCAAEGKSLLIDCFNQACLTGCKVGVVFKVNPVFDHCRV